MRYDQGWDSCVDSFMETASSLRFLKNEPIFLVKVFRLERIVLVFTMWTQQVDVQHLIYWQGHHVCDALFYQRTKTGSSPILKQLETPTGSSLTYLNNRTTMVMTYGHKCCK